MLNAGHIHYDLPRRHRDLGSSPLSCCMEHWDILEPRFELILDLKLGTCNIAIKIILFIYYFFARILCLLVRVSLNLT